MMRASLLRHRFPFILVAVALVALAVLLVHDTGPALAQSSHDGAAGAEPAKTYSIDGTATVPEGGFGELTVTLSESAPAGGVAFTMMTDMDHDAGIIVSGMLYFGLRGITVTVAEGTTTLGLTVYSSPDDVDEDDETVTVTISTTADGWEKEGSGKDVATVTITDDDTAGVTLTPTTLNVPEAGTDSYSVVLDSKPTANVTVTPTISDAGAATFTPTSYTFSPQDWMTARSFTVSGMADDDPSHESVTISHRVASSDAKYSGVAVDDVSVNVMDDETPPESQNQQPGTYSVTAYASAAEGTSAVLTLTLSEAAPAGGVALTVTAGYDGGSTATSQDVGSIGSPVFVAEGNTNLEIVIPTTPDAVDEEDETFTVTVVAATTGWTKAGDGKDTATVTIQDDDTAGVLVSPTMLSFAEGSMQAYAVSLESMPSHDVTITPRVSDDRGVTLLRSSRTFTPEYWNVPQLFIVYGVTEGESVTISHDVASSDGKYGGIAVASVTANVVDENLADSYYTQFLSVKGITVKATGKVDPEALYSAADIIGTMLSGNEDMSECMADSDTELAILPKDEYLSSLPEIIVLYDETKYPRQTSSWSELTGGVTSEESLLGLLSARNSKHTTTVNVLAHLIRINCFTAEDDEEWRSYYDVAVRDGMFASTQFLMEKSSLFFSEFTLAYFEVLRPGQYWQYDGLQDRSSLEADYPEIFNSLDELYGGAVILRLSNRAPVLASAIGDTTIVNESGNREVPLSGVFSDADNDSLTIAAVSSDESKATVAVESDQSKLTVAAKARGTATITVTANDGNGDGTVSNTFTVTVKARPVVASALADVSGLEESATQDVSLSGVFSDADGDSLTITASSSDETKATVSVASDGSKLTLTGVGEGTATITVTAQDSDGNQVSDTFDVSVVQATQLQQANRVPTVSAAIGDATIVNESGTHQTSLSGVFDDADDDSLTVTAASSDDTKATASVASDGSSLTVTAKAQGSATITVTADDGYGGTVEDTFTVTVKAAPTVASAISDVSGLEESATQDVSLSGVFSDADGDTLTITAASSDETKATVSVASDGSKLTLTGVAEGTSTITVTAQDSDGNQVSDTFDVSVVQATQLQQANRAPTVSSPIEDATIVNEIGTYQTSLSGVFDDADDDSLIITSTSSDMLVAIPYVATDYSMLTVIAVTRGTATITVTANDGYGGTVEDTFTVTVKAAPTVASAISDVSSLEESATQDVSLSGVFSDADGDSLTITASSSDETKATVSVASDGSKLTLTGVAEGTSTITVTAQDSDGNQVSDAFDVSVVQAAQQQEQITLPGPVLNLELTATVDTITVTWQAPESGSSPNRYIAHIKPEGGGKGATKRPKATKTTVTFKKLEAGTTYRVWVRAENEAGKGERVRASITLPETESEQGEGQQQQQEAPNQTPTVSSAIADTTIVKESGTQQVSLSGVFEDADGDALTITASSDGDAVATVSVAPDYSTLTVTANSRGTATITVRADDGNGGTVDDAFTVTVKAEPVVASPLADVTGLEMETTKEVSLAGVFSDADGDTLTISAVSSDETKATVSAASNGSTLTLAGVAEGTTTITVTAEDSDGNRVSDTFEVEVVKRFASLIPQMYEWRDDPEWKDHKEHTDRWDRALLAFGETVEDKTLTAMTANEAQGYADKGWERWVPVAKALRELEGG